jgi:hypothetical protein
MGYEFRYEPTYFFYAQVQTDNNLKELVSFDPF